MALERPKKFVNRGTDKVTKDGRTMSRDTYFRLYGDLFKSSAEKLKETKKISSGTTAKKAATKKEARKETKTAKKAAKTLKEVNKPSTSKTADAARLAAAKRALAVTPDKRTAAQKKAITTAKNRGLIRKAMAPGVAGGIPRGGSAGRAGGLGGGMNWSTK